GPQGDGADQPGSRPPRLLLSSGTSGKLSRGISTSRFLRSCSRAPRMMIEPLILTSSIDVPAMAYRYNLDDLLFVIYAVENAILSDTQPIFLPVRQFLDPLRSGGVS